VIIVLRHTLRAFVDKLDFTTTPGHLADGGSRSELGLSGAGPSLVITDLGLLEPDPERNELVLTSLNPGVDVAEVQAHTGWDLQVRSPLPVTPPPTAEELATLRRLQASRA
jgi:glutaconate CoA-transferase subunit B